jgi:hypothetical protein
MGPAIIVAGVAALPRLTWRWESETDILSGTYRTARHGETAETVELSSDNGAVAVLDVVGGEICGVDIVIWPDVETITGLLPPAPQVVGRVLLPPATDGPGEIETELAVAVDGLEQTFHLRVGEPRPMTVVQVADHLLIEVDADGQLAGFWLAGVPPFPSEE